MGCFGGGGGVEVPGPTAQEIELQSMQLESAKRAAAEDAALKPYILQAYGMKVTPSTSEQLNRAQQLREEINAYNVAGGSEDPAANAAQQNKINELNSLSNTGYTKMTEEEVLAGMNPQEQLQYQNTKLEQERVNQALKGELPVDPALEKNIADEQAVIEEQLARDLGPNWRNSTAGIQRMGEFSKRAELLRESARRGEINTGTGLALNQMGYLGANAVQTGANYQSVPAGSMGYASSLNSVLQPYQQQRQMQYGANVAQYQANAQENSAMMTGIGTMTGLALAPFTAGLSIPASKVATTGLNRWGGG